MLNQSAGDKTTFTEKLTNCFDSINTIIYEKLPENPLPELHACTKEIKELLAAHPWHPQLKPVFAEYVPYLVCGMDYHLRLLQHSGTDDGTLKEKEAALLQLYGLLNSDWQQLFIPASCKLPESFLVQERIYLREECNSISAEWELLDLQLPAILVLEPALTIIQTPCWQITTYAQWLYARNLLFHMQEMLNKQRETITEDDIVKQLIGLRYNTSTFSEWFIEDTRQKIQRACNVAEKKSA